jgi:CRP/FNR family transcriptional regulator, anaerobic regulatory protein
MLATAIHEARPGFIPMSVRALPCRACAARRKGVCGAASDQALDRLAGVVAPMRVAAGETFLDEGDEATHFFTVTAGSVKLYKLLSDGRRQVTGFLFQGDFLGLGCGDTHGYSAEALTDATLCRFPRRQFDGFLEAHPAMERRLLAMMSDELAAARDQMVTLGRKTARERVASFLIGLVRRQERLGRDGKAVRLTMTRTDIADYLGLTTETVSRIFTGFRTAGLIELDGTTLVRILDRAALVETAEMAA